MRGALLLSLILCAPDARAEDDRSVTQYVPDDDLSATSDSEEAPPEGWDGALSLGASLSLTHASGVLGQVDGVSFSAVASAVADLEYRAGPHELDLALSVYEGASVSPALDRVAKTGDRLKLEPRYSFFTFPWLGVFARATAEAPILPTDDLRAADVVYAIARTSGVVEQATGRERALAGALQPLTITQSLGLVCRPIDALEGVMLVRIGAGGRQTFAAGALLIADDTTTPVIELIELEDVIQAGAEMAISVSGRLPEQHLSYAVDVSGLMPVLNNDPLGRTAFDLFRVGLVGDVSYHASDFLGVSWQFRILQDPQLTTAAQVQNLLLVTLDFQVIGAARKRLSPLEAAQARQQAAEARQREAEARQREAEERAREAEARTHPGPRSEGGS